MNFGVLPPISPSPSDGEMMKDMLEKSQFVVVKVVTNCEDILIYNANIELNKWNYRRHFEGDTAFTNYQVKDDTATGDCMVGTTGKLCPVELIKRKVLYLLSERWTMTLDMCRGLSMRGKPKEKM